MHLVCSWWESEMLGASEEGYLAKLCFPLDSVSNKSVGLVETSNSNDAGDSNSSQYVLGGQKESKSFICASRRMLVESP